jgi:glutamine synthetase
MSEKDKKLKALDELIELANGGHLKGNGKFPAISPDITVCQTPKEVIEFAQSRGLMIADVKFTDLFGRWHHFSMPIQYITEDIFEDGLGFDGSSIRAFQDIHESDMILFPDPASAVVDPVLDVPTLSLTCNIHDPITLEPYNKDVRYIAQKAEAFLISEGIADVSYWGPEAEFFVFDGVSFDYQTRGAHFTIESDMGSWEARRGFSQRFGPNLGYRPEMKRGYFRVPPVDKLQDWRSEAILRMMTVGIDVEVHHGEVASAGQQEIDLKYTTLTRSADQMQWYKYILKNTAVAWGKTVTFMPKPMFEDNGSGMHTHQSLWKGGSNLFFDPNGYASLSQTALYYIGGILKHTPSLLALCAPTTNSYKRLVPGYEAPVMMAYSQRNRSACIRIPVYSASESSKRIEYRSPDPTANPYMAFAAMVMAGVDGIINEIDPGGPMDLDLYESEVEVPQVPGSLTEVLDNLEADHEFLMRGDVFTPDVIDVFIEWKRKQEVDAIRMRPHPYEYALYYDM